MIEKICPEHQVPVYGERCGKEGCTHRPIVKTTIYWCPVCQVPSFEKRCLCCGAEGSYAGTDARPVFVQERLLLALLLELESPLALVEKNVWNIGGRYFVDGDKINLSLAKLRELSLNQIQKLRENYVKYEEQLDDAQFQCQVKRFCQVNEQRYHAITAEAIDYIQSYEEKYHREEMFVSFSGGKDSTVTSDLVMRALATNKITHIFGDTTLEFPLTYEYRERFSKTCRVLRAKNHEKNFEQMCEVIGPPSRVMRWCCTVFKTGAITKKLEQVFKGKTKILTFYGIRKSESASRSKYERETESPKITRQVVVSPIIDWIDFDIWLYILTTGIDFNEAYRLGYTRVGCWCCPNNGVWSEFLSKIHMYDQYMHWREILVNFAKKIGKPDAENYVDQGNWKARQGGQGLEISNTSIIRFEPCATEDQAFNYELQSVITTELYEFFKPFGYLNFEMGNQRLGQVYVLDAKGRVNLVLQGRIGTNRLKVTIKNPKLAGAKNLLAAEGKIKCQLTKYQMCLGCKACPAVCKYNAISVHSIVDEEGDEQVIYRIDDEKCRRCTECVDHFNAGCYMRKVLTIKRDG